MTHFLLFAAHASTLPVGDGLDYVRISDAIAASSPGDVIEVHSGTYVDDTVVFPHGDLVVRGVGEGRPVLLVTEDIPNRKGIFVIPEGAETVLVEGLRFEGARISDEDGGNGAGIRMQGADLVVRDCHFTDNQMGILAGGTDGFTVHIEASEFDENGRDGSGYEHNVYLGTDECARLTFVGNYSHHARTGHNLKSRCQENRILYNRIMDESDGQSSYTIDLPEGGRNILIGNLLQQGPEVENSSAIVSIAAEGTNDEMLLYASHNTIVNDRESDATAFIRATQADRVVLRNNLFIGKGTPLSVQDDAEVDDQGSLHLLDEDALIDRAGFDYRLADGASPIDGGVELAPVDGEELVAVSQYVHPLQTEPRWDDGPPDVGAYGIGEPGDTGELADSERPQDSVIESGCGCASGGRRAWGPMILLPLMATRRRDPAV